MCQASQLHCSVLASASPKIATSPERNKQLERKITNILYKENIGWGGGGGHGLDQSGSG
jgi:hypothetical protein